MSQYKCTLWPSGEVLDLNGEETLLGQLKKAGKKIKSSCGGCATCSDCIVVVKSGELNLTAQTFEELRLLGNVFHITKERLSCQSRLLGDVTIDISAHEKKAAPVKETTVVKKSSTRLKKREDVEKTVKEREEKSEARPKDTWFKHWEKEEEDPNKPKKLGGNKRPRPFNYSETDKDETEE